MLTIGEIIRRKREAKGWSRYRLAKTIGANDTTVLAWEAGRSYPTALYLCDLADVFGCSVDELLGRIRGAEK